jgi:hypothetical protein
MPACPFQARIHPFGERGITRPETGHLAAKHFINNVLHQGNKTNLWISAGAAD